MGMRRRNTKTNRAAPGHVEPFLRIMAGLVPAIYILPPSFSKKDVDAISSRA
jgi:hypothetical protein